MYRFVFIANNNTWKVVEKVVDYFTSS